MHPAKIFFGVLSLVGGLAILSWLMTLSLAPQEEMPAEVDIARPRAPSEARTIKNPLPASEESIARGKAIYHEKGACVVCHGEQGRGDGPAGAMTQPSPRDFTLPTFHSMRTDGELFWVLNHGIPGTGMISFVPRFISEGEAWSVIRYLRTFNTPTHESVVP
jgi:mono/diheme cytochrome c family protein